MMAFVPASQFTVFTDKVKLPFLEVDSATSPLLFHADNDDRKNANYASASNEVPSDLGKLLVDSSAFMDQLFSDFRLYFVAFEGIMGMTKKQ